ncbi:MAG TPA: MFS transporter [Candidatus Krumholzibacteria bacterium]|nr:MFS transporter [Candidatus Krumholzibacteria bacterium]HPD71157.1 MFS transporter [Candidatus Krumholzibacteria bacterium]HRY39143.1 MFS transporter [Candidatus Krumholzibacteria bacterium]
MAAADSDSPAAGRATWRFSRPFWVANGVEVLERAAWYGVFVAITIYLSRVLGFNDVQAGVISGLFSAGLYLLPTFSGAYADRIGFRASLLLAFGLLTVGYASMWVLPALIEAGGLAAYGREVEFTGLELTWYKWLFIPVMLVVMVGGSFIKSVITGTVARETNEINRARGYSIFYAMVNVGSFSGKTIVQPLRVSLGDEGLIVLNLYAAGMTLLALVLVARFYRASRPAQRAKTLAEIWRSLVAVCTRWRLLALILIITGFWMVQAQLYATMPKYVLRMAGEGSAFSWYANVNPAVVVLTVAWITQLMRRRSALASMTVGMFIMPLSAFCMAAGNMIASGTLFGVSAIAAMMLIGIAFQGLAESFISPRFLEYFSKQAPEGEEGLYLGFSHLHSFLSAVFGFSLSGVLLQRWCPEPTTLPDAVQQQRLRALAGDAPWPDAYAHAHYIWFVFVGVAIVSAVALIAFGVITRRLDERAARGA